MTVKPPPRRVTSSPLFFVAAVGLGAALAVYLVLQLVPSAGGSSFLVPAVLVVALAVVVARFRNRANR